MIRKCPFCDVVVFNNPHIYHCKLKTTNDKREIKFMFIQKNFPHISKREVITLNYVENLKSLVDIKNDFNIDFKSFIFLLEYYSIPKRSISESSKLISSIKYKKTCMEKYGVDNVSKVLDIKNKKSDTFMKNYGVDNIFKNNEFKKWIIDNNFAWNNLTDDENEIRKCKQKESIKKYWNNLNDEQKNKIFNYNGKSNLETKISEVLNNLSISYTTQFPLKGKLFDFRLVNTNILIEVNGDYWHCNPEIYNIDESIKFPGGYKKVSDIWDKDRDKRIKAEEIGYFVIYIWESEIKKTKDLTSLVLNKLSSFVDPGDQGR
jgi:G:T-mismatch repair DNA endonuclease (very short patch repair protein)